MSNYDPTRHRATWRSQRERWESGLMQVIEDSGLVRESRVELGHGGYRVRGRIHPAWWLALGARHLSVRARLRDELPKARLYAGVTLPVCSVVVL